jgi:hypothetical protein
MGDPMDDWAWVDSRAHCVDPTAYHALDADASAISVNENRIAYWHAAVDYRCVITTSLAVARGGGARGLHPACS